jgi:DNA-binding PadR family transcriptional regulator
VSAELKHVLYHRICDDFERALQQVEENVSRYAELLAKVHEHKSWPIVIAVQGEDTKDPTLKDFDLLESAGLLESETKFTHRNIDKTFRLSEKGRKLVEKFKAQGA